MLAAASGNRASEQSSVAAGGKPLAWRADFGPFTCVCSTSPEQLQSASGEIRIGAAGCVGVRYPVTGGVCDGGRMAEKAELLSHNPRRWQAPHVSFAASPSLAREASTSRGPPPAEPGTGERAARGGGGDGPSASRRIAEALRCGRLACADDDLRSLQGSGTAGVDEASCELARRVGRRFRDSLAQELELRRGGDAIAGTCGAGGWEYSFEQADGLWRFAFTHGYHGVDVLAAYVGLCEYGLCQLYAGETCSLEPSGTSCYDTRDCHEWKLSHPSTRTSRRDFHQHST